MFPDLFENASFLYVLGWRPHGDGIFGHRKRRFLKRLSRIDLFDRIGFPVLVWTGDNGAF